MSHRGKCSRLILLLLFLTKFASLIEAVDIPHCSYADTVDLTGSLKYNNGSYLFKGIVVPAELTGTYDYKMEMNDERVSVPQHVRGCICKLRSCVQFCCHPQARRSQLDGKCEQVEELEYSPYVNITMNDGQQKLMHVIDEFIVQEGVPNCDFRFMLEPHLNDEDKWELFENGTLYRHYDSQYLTKHEYCLTPHEVDNATYVLIPLNCGDDTISIRTWINAIAMLVSVPFLMMTAFVYTYIPKLRNLHGKCLVCYLAFLAVGYIMFALVALSSFNFVSNDFCKIIGFATYFCFMSAFFWLNVISFDLWYNFRGMCRRTNRQAQQRRFYCYSLYAWGSAAVLTFLTYHADTSEWNEIYRPAVGDYACWLKTHDWSAMIYFFGPNLILIIFNIIMFTLTSIQIYRVQNEMSRMSTRKETSRNLNSEKQNFGLYLRLFIVMGITWLLEVLSYIVGQDNTWYYLFYAPDICNALQGLIIFVLFVLKRKVLKLIRQQKCCGDNQDQSFKGTNARCPTFQKDSKSTPSITVLYSKVSL